MAAIPKVKFKGRPLAFSRMDSRSYLIQPGVTPSPEIVPLSPTYSFGKDISYSNSPVDRSFRIGSLGSDVPLLMQNGSLSPPLSQKVPVCRPVHMGSLTQSSNIYGVGDLEHVNIEGINRNNPRMYDYADYGHQYEELPGGRKSTAKYPADAGHDSNSQYQSSGGATDIVSETGDTADIVAGSSDKRKRVNPLYDAMMMSTPSIYSKTKNSKEEKLQRQVRHFKCALIVLFIFCCASLAVSIYTVITYSKDIKVLDESDQEHSVQRSTLSDRVEKLASDYANLQELIYAVQGSNSTLEMMTNLIHKVSELERNSSTQIGILHQQIENLKKNISQNADSTDVVYTSLKSDLFNLTTSVQHQLETVSKMEGPRGPQGVANFSRCTYSNLTNNAVATSPSKTGWLPSKEDLENNFVIYAACSVDNGTGHMVETNVIDASHVQFRCVCSGVEDPNNSRRFCYLHIVTCPRNS